MFWQPQNSSSSILFLNSGDKGLFMDAVLSYSSWREYLFTRCKKLPRNQHKTLVFLRNTRFLSHKLGSTAFISVNDYTIIYLRKIIDFSKKVYILYIWRISNSKIRDGIEYELWCGKNPIILTMLMDCVTLPELDNP